MSALWLDHHSSYANKELLKQLCGGTTNKWLNCQKTEQTQNIVVDTIDRQNQDSIEALEEILGSLRITEDYASDKNRITKIALEEKLTVPALAVHNEIAQVVILKSMVLKPGQLYGNQMKFKDQQKKI